MCVHAATNYTDTMLEYWWITRTRCWIIGGLQDTNWSIGGLHGHNVGVLVDYTDTKLEYWWATLTQCWSIGGLCGQDVGVLVD